MDGRPSKTEKLLILGSSNVKRFYRPHIFLRQKLLPTYVQTFTLDQVLQTKTMDHKIIFIHTINNELKSLCQSNKDLSLLEKDISEICKTLFAFVDSLLDNGKLVALALLTKRKDVVKSKSHLRNYANMLIHNKYDNVQKVTLIYSDDIADNFKLQQDGFHFTKVAGEIYINRISMVIRTWLDNLHL